MSFRTVKAFRLKELSAFATKLKEGASASEAPLQLPNPFLPHKNPLSGRWAPPKYSLRQQADLVKSAKASNVTHLLPFGPKSPITPRIADGLPVVSQKPASTEWWQANVVWEDSKPPVEKKEKKDPSLEGDEVLKKVIPRIEVKQMEGLAALKMYAGRKRMFKGHKWERVQDQRKKRTQILMRDMSKRVARYKEVRTVPVDPTSIEGLTERFSSGTTVANPIRSSHQGVLKLPSYHSRTYSPCNTLRQHYTRLRASAFGMFVHYTPPPKSYKHGGTRHRIM
jgi:large subunit ribosomal protein L25